MSSQKWTSKNVSKGYIIGGVGVGLVSSNGRRGPQIREHG